MKLTGLERRWAHAIFDAMLPRAGDPSLPKGIEDLDLDGYLDDLGRSWPASAFVGLRGAIACVALAPVLVHGRPRTMTALSPEQRVAVLDRLAASDVYLARAMVTMLKAAGGVLYGSSETMRRAVQRDQAPHPTDARVALRRQPGTPPRAVATAVRS